VNDLNSTPDFDRLAAVFPLEPSARIRISAIARLVVVAVSLVYCLVTHFNFVQHPPRTEAFLIVLGIWIGHGFYGESMEFGWAKLGESGQYVALVMFLIFAGCVVWLQPDPWARFAILTVTLLILIWQMIGLWWALRSPLRASRYRQMIRYVRSVPRNQRKTERRRMRLNFETLVAEGFA
jgi:predicted tellurium resistance membrane protein TerC